MVYEHRSEAASMALQQDRAAKAWLIVLHHPAVCSNQCNVCTLLQVSNAIRTDLLSPDNHLVNLQLTRLPRAGGWGEHPLQSAALLSSFAAWIPKHAGLARSIEISRAIFGLWHVDPNAAYSCDSDHDDDDDDDAVAAATRRAKHVLPVLQEQFQLDSCVANPVLQHSLLLAALHPSEISLAAKFGCSAATAAPSAFQLQSFSSNFNPSAAVLSALPAASLTKFALSPAAPLPNPQNLAALTRLTNLQVLDLQLGGLFVEQDWSAISQLSKVTTITLDLVWNDIPQLALLPGQLQQVNLFLTDPFEAVFLMLNVLVSSADDSYSAVTVNLSHLTALQRLRLRNQTSNAFAPGNMLAPTVQDLTVEHHSAKEPHCAIAPLSASRLQHLQRLELCNCTDSAQDLLSLKNSPRLRHLSLSYQGPFLPDNLGVAAVWQQLPIKHLSVSSMRMTAEQAISLLNGIGAATTLTSLVYKVTVPYRMEDAPGAKHPLNSHEWFRWLMNPDMTRIPTCQLLKGLTNLQSLKLGFDGNGYLQPCCLVQERQQPALARNAVEDPGIMMSSTSLLPDGGISTEAMHLTALQQLTHLDFRGVDVPGIGFTFVNECVVDRLSSALHNLRELHLAPGRAHARLELADCVSDLARITTLQTLSIQGAKEQDPEYDDELESQRLERGYCWDQSLTDCLWKLTQLTRLTALSGFESCEQTEVQRFWDVLTA